MGRFLTRDPIGVWQDRVNAGNEYCYVGNRVLSYGDQFGLQADPVPGHPDLREFGKWAGEVAVSAIGKAWDSWSWDGVASLGDLACSFAEELPGAVFDVYLARIREAEFKAQLQTDMCRQTLDAMMSTSQPRLFGRQYAIDVPVGGRWFVGAGVTFPYNDNGERIGLEGSISLGINFEE